MLTIAAVDENVIRVNVIPQRKVDKENDTAETALASPLTISGTAEELDREFANQIGAFRASVDRLRSNLSEIESAHAAALKTVEEEKKKELNSKRKTSSAAVKPARNDSESAPAQANGKPVFGGKPHSTTGPTTQSLFDSGPAGTSDEQSAEPEPGNSSETRAEALAHNGESGFSQQSPAITSDQPPNADSKAAPTVECGICHTPIFPNQQRHSLMPFVAHASASDCEAARKNIATIGN
jgi:PRTRC genetic system protein E